MYKRNEHEISSKHIQKVRQSDTKLNRKTNEFSQQVTSVMRRRLLNPLITLFQLISILFQSLIVLFWLSVFLFTIWWGIVFTIQMPGKLLFVPLVFLLYSLPGVCKFYVFIAAVATIFGGLGHGDIPGQVPLELSLPLGSLPLGLRTFCIARGLSTSSTKTDTYDINRYLLEVKGWAIGTGLFFIAIGVFDNPLISSVPTIYAPEGLAHVVRIIVGLFAITRISSSKKG